MAGYLMNLDSVASLEYYAQNGIYGTVIGEPRNNLWITPYEATFADYVTMKSGDNIYFFIERKIYGIGKLVDVRGDCRYCNYPDSSLPQTYSYQQQRANLLLDEGEKSIKQRWVCLFEPDPYFFKLGIDMDDLLLSDPPAFKMLRALWKLSFVKFDDSENQAFKNAILKACEGAMQNPQVGTNIFQAAQTAIHQGIAGKLSTASYGLDARPILAAATRDSIVRHEMAVEASLLDQISSGETGAIAVFGHWDYLSHQVIASPFKPIDYMDKMDLFWYRYVKGYKPTKSRFLVGEVKKVTGLIGDIDQIMKYVDWLRDEYCYGDYAMIEAFLIAPSIPVPVRSYALQNAVRRYTAGSHPARSLEWRQLKLVECAYNPNSQKLDLVVV